MGSGGGGLHWVKQRISNRNTHRYSRVVFISIGRVVFSTLGGSGASEATLDHIFPMLALLARKKQELRRSVRKSHVHLVEAVSIDTESLGNPLLCFYGSEDILGLSHFKSFILYEFLRGRKRMRLREWIHQILQKFSRKGYMTIYKYSPLTMPLLPSAAKGCY